MLQGKLLLAIFFFLLLYSSRAEGALTCTTDSISSKRQDTVLPSFPGGEEALIQFLNSKIYYPEECKLGALRGTVHVSFQVDENGKISNITTGRPSGNVAFEEVVISVIRLMPDWHSGLINGFPTTMIMYLPIDFTIRGKRKGDRMPLGALSYKCYFGKGSDLVIPLVEVDSVKLSDEEFYIYHEFENLPLLKHELKMIVVDTAGKEIKTSKYSWKAKFDYETLTYKRFLEPSLSPGAWTFKFYLNDSLLKERDLLVLPADSVIDEFFMGVSAGYQYGKYNVAELNYILIGSTEKASPVGVSVLVGAEHNLDSRMNAFKLGLVVSHWISLGFHLKHFADFQGANSFGFQPELGIGYKLFNLSYGYNLQFKKDFPGINRHFIVLRMGLRVLKV